MDRVIKKIPASCGELYAVAAGQRRLVARFDGRVEIIENTKLVPILGIVQKGAKIIYASFIVCGGLEYRTETGSSNMHSGKVYEAFADIEGERIDFAGLQFEDSDPVKNELIFRIADVELIEKLLD